MKIIAYYEHGWFDYNITDYRMWDHLCRAYNVDLQMISHWKEAYIPNESNIYLVDELGEIALENHTIDYSGVYVFGRTLLDLFNEVNRYTDTDSVRIITPNKICLFGIVAASIILSRTV